MKHKKKAKILFFIAMICVICFSSILINLKNDNNVKASELENNVVEIQTMFPYKVNKSMTVESIFQFSGVNPESGNEGENIAGLLVTNTSDKYIENADVYVKIKNSDELHFLIKDLPAGKSINVFEKNDKQFKLTDEIVSVKGKDSFYKHNPIFEEKTSIVVDGTNITIMNLSNENLENMVIHCHCILDDVYFGGLTYTYSINEIKVGETVQLDAVDCYMGEAAVVRMSQYDVNN